MSLHAQEPAGPGQDAAEAAGARPLYNLRESPFFQDTLRTSPGAQYPLSLFVGREVEAERLLAPGRTPAGDAVSALVVRVLRLAARLTAAGDALARPAGQTSARWQVLAAVEALGDAPGHGASAGGTTVADVARALGLARQSVQRVADLLVADGAARYRDNPAHQRAKLLALTPDGARALGAIQAAQRGWADALGERLGAAGVGAAEVARTGTVLDALEHTLDAVTPTNAGRHPT